MTGVFEMSPPFLVEALRLPQGTTVTDVRMTEDGRSIQVTVAHPAITTPWVEPVYTRAPEGEAVFVEWGER